MWENPALCDVCEVFFYKQYLKVLIEFSQVLEAKKILI